MPNTDLDLKQAIQNMNETADVLSVVKEFEKGFYDCKKRINDADLVTLESELTV